MRKTSIEHTEPNRYSDDPMASKKSKLDKATDILAKIVQQQIDTLSPAVATAKRKKLHDLAARVSTSSAR
jgi:hypothetical protein